jgi:hypothetical protein
MVTKRTPINRDHRRQFSPLAIELFGKLKAAEDKDEWWEIHNQLHDELRCKPWEWPCVQDPDPEVERNYEPRPEALALWAALEGAR